MGKEDKDDEKDSPYSVCGGCCLGTTLLLLLIMLLLALFGGLSAADEAGKMPMMGSPWIIADCKINGGKAVQYVATPWEICYENNNAGGGMVNGFDADLFEFISDTRDGSNTRVCQEWVNIDEEGTWKVLCKGFKDASTSACFALACIFVIAALLCLIIHSDIKNKCLLLVMSILIIMALLLAFCAVMLTAGNADLMDKDKWEDESLCVSSTEVSIGYGVQLWLLVCILVFLFAFLFCSPLCCGCGMCALCAANGAGGTSCCAGSAEGGGEGAKTGCIHKIDVCVTTVCKKIAVVIETVYVGAKACTGKILTCVLPLLCFPCFMLDKATKGNDVPSPCMVNIATGCLLTSVLNVCVGTFWGYPAPYPKNEGECVVYI
jgi:hypothetical protein